MLQRLPQARGQAWYTAIEVRKDNADLAYESDWWFTQEPINAGSGTENVINAAYHDIYVEKVRVTMNYTGSCGGSGCSAVWNLRDADQNIFTLRDLATRDGGTLVRTSEIGDDDIYLSALNKWEFPTDATYYYCTPFGFNHHAHTSAWYRWQLNRPRARIGVAMDTQSPCSDPHSAEGLGIDVQFARYPHMRASAGRVTTAGSAWYVYSNATVEVFGTPISAEAQSNWLVYSSIAVAGQTTFPVLNDRVVEAHPFEEPDEVYTFMYYLKVERLERLDSYLFQMANSAQSEYNPRNILYSDRSDTNVNNPLYTGRAFYFTFKTEENVQFNYWIYSQLTIGRWHQIAWSVDGYSMDVHIDGVCISSYRPIGRREFLDEWNLDLARQSHLHHSATISDLRYYEDQKLGEDELVPIYNTFVAAHIGCSDGVREVDEECDDGNTFSGDGCSSNCTVEAGFVCHAGNSTRVVSDQCNPGEVLFLADFEDDEGLQHTPTLRHEFSGYNWPNFSVSHTGTGDNTIANNFYDNPAGCPIWNPMLGGYGHFGRGLDLEPTTLLYNLTDLPPHNYVEIDMSIIFLDNVYNYFYISVDNVLTLHLYKREFYKVHGSILEEGSDARSCGRTGDYDDYAHWVHRVYHNASSIEIRWWGVFTSTTTNRAWGMHNMSIEFGIATPFAIETMATALYNVSTTYGHDYTRPLGHSKKGSGLHIQHRGEQEVDWGGMPFTRFTLPIEDKVDANTWLEFYRRLTLMPVMGQYSGMEVMLIANETQRPNPSTLYAYDDCLGQKLNCDNSTFVRFCFNARYFRTDPANLYGSYTAWSNLYCDKHDWAPHNWYLETIDIMDQFRTKYGPDFGKDGAFVTAVFKLRANYYGFSKRISAAFDNIAVKRMNTEFSGNVTQCPRILVTASNDSVAGASIMVGATEHAPQQPGWNIVILDGTTHAVLDSWVATTGGPHEIPPRIANASITVLVAVATQGPIVMPTCDANCSTVLQDLGLPPFPQGDAAANRSYAGIGSMAAHNAPRTMPAESRHFDEGVSRVTNDFPCTWQEYAINEGANAYTKLTPSYKRGNFSYIMQNQTFGYRGCYRYDTYVQENDYIYAGVCSSWAHSSPANCQLCCGDSGYPFFWMRRQQCYCTGTLPTDYCDFNGDCGAQLMGEQDCRRYSVRGDTRQTTSTWSLAQHNAVIVYETSGARDLGRHEMDVNCSSSWQNREPLYCPQLIDDVMSNGWIGFDTDEFVNLTITLRQPAQVDRFRIFWEDATYNHAEKWAVFYRTATSPEWVLVRNETDGHNSNPYLTDVDGVNGFPDNVFVQKIMLYMYQWNGVNREYRIHELGVTVFDNNSYAQRANAIRRQNNATLGELLIPYTARNIRSSATYRMADYFGWDPLTGQTWLTYGTFRRYIQPEYRLAMTRVDNAFDTDWFHVDVASANFYEFSHGLGVLPMSFSALVRSDGFGATHDGYYFNTMGSVAVDGTEVGGESYGGVLVAYNEDTVRVWVPSNTSYGYVINTLEGWGSTYIAGDQRADVRVKASRGTPPDFDSGWISICSQCVSGNQVDVLHNFGRNVQFARLKVLYRAVDGPNAGYVFEAEGSAQADNDAGHYGGVVYGYSEDMVRIWAPNNTDVSGDDCALGETKQEIGPQVKCAPCPGYAGVCRHDLGRVIFVPNSYGNGMYTQQSNFAEVRVVIWDYVDMGHVSAPQVMSADGISSEEGDHDMNFNELVGFKTVVQPASGPYSDWWFNGQGAAQGTDKRAREYGGVLASIDFDEWRFWAPAKSDPGYIHAEGILVFAGDGWGDGSAPASEVDGAVSVVMWRSDFTQQRETAYHTLRIMEGNEAPSIDSVTLTVNEQVKEDSVALVLPGTDPNGDVGLTYNIVEGNHKNAFRIEGGNLVINNRAAFDFEKITSFVVSVSVSDGALTDVTQFTVNIEDANDIPRLWPPFYREINENSAKNAKVGDPINATDTDFGQSILFYLLDEGNYRDAFYISRCEGQIRVKTPTALDHENVTGFSLFRLTVLVTDDGADAGNDTATVTVNVTDGNDPPYWNNTNQAMEVDENTPAGVAVSNTLFNYCFDDDRGDYLTFLVLYTVYTPPPGLNISLGSTPLFSVNDTSGQVLVGSAPLDFESGLTDFTLKVRCTDNNDDRIQIPPNLYVDDFVTVQVNDANDPPVFVESPIKRTIDENPDPSAFPLLITGLDIFATDEDVLDTVAYRLEDTLNDTFYLVELGPALGANVYVNGTGINFDFERNRTILIPITAYDTGLLANNLTVQAQNTTEYMVLTLNDVNEAPSVVQSTIYVNEDFSGVGDLGLINATDPDIFRVEDLLFTLEDVYPNVGGGVFSLENVFLDHFATLEIAVADFFNYELVSSYQLQIRVEDPAPLADVANVTLQVVDRNDAPVYNCSLLGAICEVWTVPENSITGISVAFVDVSDEDGDVLMFALTATSDPYVLDRFAINNSTGEFYVDTTLSGEELDYESAVTGNTFEVGASDVTLKAPGNTTSTKLFRIQLTDVPEAPTWDQILLDAVINSSLPETASNGDTIGVPLANVFSDEDIGDVLRYNVSENCTIRRSVDGLTLNTTLHGVPNPFAVNSSTGVISLISKSSVRAFDTIIFDTYVSDGVFTLDFEFRVGIVPDNTAPSFNNASLWSSCVVEENSAIGTFVCFVNATDPDAGDNINYFWSAQPPLFTMVSVPGPNGTNIGKITVRNTGLNYEVTPVYNLDIFAKDDHLNGNFPLFTYDSLRIRVTDVNDDPIPLQSQYNFNVTENSVLGTSLVGDPIELTDEDGHAMLFSIASGGSAPVALNVLGANRTGFVVNASVDFESQNSYALTISADDQNGGVVIIPVTINVLDVNEEPLMNNVTVVMRENAASGTAAHIVGGGITVLNSSDPEEDVMNFNIVAGNSGGYFRVVAIPPSQYRIELDPAAPVLDYENTQSFSLKVRATEAATADMFSDTATVTVLVENENDLTVGDVRGDRMGWPVRHDWYTDGGEHVTITGTNFGIVNAREPMNVRYGPTGDEYRATNCSVSVPGNTEIVCRTAPGVGVLHSWSVTALQYNHTATISEATSYERPLITGFTPPDLRRTQGGDSVAVDGGGFGDSADMTLQHNGLGTVRKETATVFSLRDAFNTTDMCRAGLALFTLEAGDSVFLQCEAGCSGLDPTEMHELVVVSVLDSTEVGINGSSDCLVDPTVGQWSQMWNANGTLLDKGELTAVPIRSIWANEAGGSPGLPTTLSGRVWRVLLPAKLSFMLLKSSYQGVTYIEGQNLQSQCTGASHTNATCSTPAGVGQDYSLRVFVAGQLSDASPDTYTYTAPVVLGVECVDCATETTLDTRGGERLYIYGAFFTGDSTVGLEFETYGAGSATYGENGGVDPPGGFTATSCSEMTFLSGLWPAGVNATMDWNGTAVDVNVVRCQSIAGVGRNLSWTVHVGGQSATDPGAATAGVSYRPPVLSSMVETWPFPSTAGGSPVTITGDYFGPASLSASLRRLEGAYGSEEQFMSGQLFTTDAGSCKIQVAQTQMVCDTGPGTGKGHNWRLTVQNQTSNVYEANSRYNSPILGGFSVNTSSDKFAVATDEADTAGEELIRVIGFNFGPSDKPGMYRPPIVATATWTEDETTSHTFNVDNCSVTNPHVELTCRTSEGVGKDIEWTIQVDNQTNVYASTSYGAPVIYNVTGLGFNITDGLDTVGGQTLVITGENFGANFSLLERVSYGPTGTEYAMHVAEDASVRHCTSLVHTEIRCQTVVGVGQGLRFVVSVAGRDALPALGEPLVSYKPPVIDSWGFQSGTTAGGYALRITGSNFGPRKLLTLMFWGATMPTGIISYDYDGQIFLNLPVGQARNHTVQILHETASCTGTCRQFSNAFNFSYVAPRVERFTVERVTGNANALDLEFFGASSGSSNLDGGSFGEGTKRFNAKAQAYGVDFDWTKDNAQTTSFFNRIEVYEEVNPNISLSLHVPVAHCLITNGSWSHDYIGCRVPRRNGTLVLWAGDEHSAPLEFDDKAPNIFSIAYPPTGGRPTTGGFHMLIRGQYFGTDTAEIEVRFRLEGPGGVRFVDDELCALSSLTVVDAVNEIADLNCTAPAGEGYNVSVYVRYVSTGVSSVIANTTAGDPCVACMSYDAPELTSYRLDDAGPAVRALPIAVNTTGGNVTVFGTNLGRPSSLRLYLGSISGPGEEMVLNVGGVPHTSVRFAIPPVLRNKQLRLRVANYELMHANLSMLVARSVILDVNPKVDLPTAGGTVVRIIGTNFGAQVSNMTLGPGAADPTIITLQDGNVMVTGRTNLATWAGDVTFERLLNWTHSEIAFVTPSGGGLNRPLRVYNVASNLSYIGLDYRVPELFSVSPTNGSTTGYDNGTHVIVKLEGQNLGDDDLQLDRFVTFGSERINMSSPLWIDSNHTSIRFYLPEGQGFDLNVSVTVGGQRSPQTLLFNYYPAVLLSIDSDTDTEVAGSVAYGPTGACAQYEDAADYLRSAAANQALLRTCDEPSVLTIRGRDFGTHSLRLVVGPWTCETDEDGDLVPGQSTWDCTDLNLGSTPFSHTHDVIQVRSPQGFGLFLQVQLFVSGRRDARDSIRAVFHYMAPEVLLGDPGSGNANDQEWFDARGDELILIGENFGENSSDTNVTIGGEPCENAVWNDGDVFGLGRPYVTCDLPEVKVGPKGGKIFIANQTAAITILQSADEYPFDPTVDSDNVLTAICKDDFSESNERTTFYGLPVYEEYCVECPEGSLCSSDAYLADPQADTAFWRLYYDVDSARAKDRCPERRREKSLTNRTECADYVGCVPDFACKGDNLCEKGYEYLKFECEDKVDAGTVCHSDFNCTGGKECTLRDPEGCSYCQKDYAWQNTGTCVCEDGWDRCAFCTVFEYYKINGECEPCPANVWVIIVLFCSALVFFAVAGYILNKKKFNLAFISIGFDYFQVLAVFSSSNVPWPNIMVQFFLFIQFFSFDIDITAPECVMPDFTYELKWTLTMVFPLMAFGMFLVMHFYYVVYRMATGERGWRKLNSHHTILVAMFVVMLYYLYLPLTRKILEIFNCNPVVPDDGYLYTEWTSINCEGGLCRCWQEGEPQMNLFPWAVICFCFYSLGYPVFAAWIIFTNKRKLKEDQLLRAMDLGDTKATNPVAFELRQKYHKLYYHFKPGKVYWIIIIIQRKFWIALAALMFRDNPTFQLSFILMVLFIGYVLQVKNRPFMSSVEREDEIRRHRRKMKEEEMKAEEELGDADDAAQFLHHKIEEHLIKIETQDRVEKNRRRTSRIDDLEKKYRETRTYYFDFNQVESTLLACAIFVCLSGIMFESQSYESRANLDAYLSALAVIVMIVIIGSLVYYFVVFASEVFSALGFENSPFIQKYFMQSKLNRPQDDHFVMTNVSTIVAQKRRAEIDDELERLKEQNDEEKKQREEAEIRKLMEENKKLAQEGTALRRRATELDRAKHQLHARVGRAKKKRDFDGDDREEQGERAAAAVAEMVGGEANGGGAGNDGEGESTAPARRGSTHNALHEHGDL